MHNMDLFSQITEQPTNLLHKDGTVNYYGTLMSLSDANDYLIRLLNTIEWKNDEAIIFGKHIVTKRKAAWYGAKSLNTPTPTPQKQHYLGLRNCLH